MSARVSRARSTQRVRTSEQPQPPYHVIAHDLFTDALARERARADRFDQPFVLLVIEVDKAARLPPSVWTSVIEALTVAAGTTAILGWVETRRTLGALVPEICSFNPETLVRRELSRRLDAETVARFSIRSHVHCPSSARPEDRQTSEPFAAGPRSPGLSGQAHYGIKRILDIAASVALLLILSPLLLLIAVLLKLTSPGPILFRQIASGPGGETVCDAEVPFHARERRSGAAS